MRHFHRLQLANPGAFRHAVFAVVEQMPHIGNIAHVTHLKPFVQQIAVDDVKTDERPAVSQVDIAVYSGSADIHAHAAFVKGLEYFFFFGKAVVDFQRKVHMGIVFMFEWVRRMGQKYEKVQGL